MIVKKIELELCFPDEFVPPEKYYDGNKECHGECPFWNEDWELGGWCKIAADGEECPLKKYFN